MMDGYETYYPGHGAPIAHPTDRVNELITHRRMREAQILEALANGPGNAKELAEAIYSDVDVELLPAAQRNVLAHLIDLTQRRLIKPREAMAETATFALV